MGPKSTAPPGLTSFLNILNKNENKHDTNAYIELFISLLSRRQIRNSRSVAIATAELLLRVISVYKWQDLNQLIAHIKEVGNRLMAAQPREMAVGNIVRRVLGLIREEYEGDSKAGNISVYSDSGLDSITGRKRGESTSVLFSNLQPVLDGGEAGLLKPQVTRTTFAHQGGQFTSMFSLLSHPGSPEQNGTSTPPPTSHSSVPPTPTQSITTTATTITTEKSPPGPPGPTRDMKPGIIEGLQEILDELLTVDDQIASYSLDHIHSNEIILTHGSSLTVQKFLLKAASKRTFTVIVAEGFPNDHEATHARVMGFDPTNPIDDDDILDEVPQEQFQKTLAQAGISVILIPDAAVYAIMSRVNKVILGTHAVLANGGLLAVAGARTIAKAARDHSTPVVVVSGVYKLSPMYPYDWEALVEIGDPGKVVSWEALGEIGEGVGEKVVSVLNPIFDYVPAELVDLYVTNLGGHAPSFLYRVVGDHYRHEDINLGV
ncbi:translation initiation factor 2B, beta subunit [Terfezia boudieri ATCC MYA-4762]|uniref:Translation initiation factor eIF2B subunit beta n=1 Tax=Terfezia boudieri ATCC MYA-4762 TaxID=1051890 RepID=A0A3N4LBI6_9PEZI|nr:translation initiation factor 2B, beta subunit [Terfezia boudieri ATCC MYA-4762]